LTLVELVVTLLVTSIIMTLAGVLVVSVNQQSTDMLDTIKGVESQTGADLSFVQYLRGATELLGVYNNANQQIGPSASELDMVVNDGFSTASSKSNWGQTQANQSNCTNIDAVWWVPTTPVNADAEFIVSSDIPSTGLPATSPWSSVPANGSGPYTYSPTSLCAPSGGASGIRALSSYFGLAGQVDPVFTYWAWSTTSSSTTSTSVATPDVPPGLLQLPLVSGVLPACAIPEVAAVGIHVTFLAGPQTPKEGFAADEPTTLNTLVFLVGAATAGATTTTTSAVTTTTTACSE
jgi:hypothetical protein